MSSWGTVQKACMGVKSLAKSVRFCISAKRCFRPTGLELVWGDKLMVLTV